MNNTMKLEIQADTSPLDECLEVLSRLESIPEFPLEPFLFLYSSLVEQIGSGSDFATLHTSDGRVFLEFGRVFELLSSALRALDGYLSHKNSPSLG